MICAVYFSVLGSEFFSNVDEVNILSFVRILMGWLLAGIVTLFTFFTVRHASVAMKVPEYNTDNTDSKDTEEDIDIKEHIS